MSALPADSHVHSEWSWDTGGPSSAAVGRMRAVCERAVRIGLPALFFTEHLDVPGGWRAGPEDLDPALLGADGAVMIEPLDAAGYLAAIETMRRDFPTLRIGTGVEFGQPHRWAQAVSSIVDLGALDRVLGSLHTLDLGTGLAEPITLFREVDAATVVRAYLDELVVMAGSDTRFDVVTHLDYPLRHWPADRAGPFDPRDFEDGYRAALRALADSGRAMELNTRRLWSWLPTWWVQEGGAAVSFGSDAHTPDAVAASFPEAALLAGELGFRPGAAPEDLWRR